MKYIAQTQSQHTTVDSFSLDKTSNFEDFKKNSKWQQDSPQSTKEQNETKKLKSFSFNPNNSEKSMNIEELTKKISKLPKSQVNLMAKYFIRLGFSLSLEPQKIATIKPERGFISNLNYLLQQFERKKLKPDENLQKVYKVFINSLFYMLMLLIKGDQPSNLLTNSIFQKQTYENEQLRCKLLQNKAFLKNFLSLQIYRQSKISKLYATVILYIYKSNQTLDVRKRLAHSIIMNLKFIDHDKTQLNMAMILNKLKSTYKVKEDLLVSQRLPNKMFQIFQKNSHAYQSVYAINYLIHLLYQFPQAFDKNIFNYSLNFVITEQMKNFISSSSFYQKTLNRYLQMTQQFKSDVEKIYSMIIYLGQITHTIESLKINKKNSIQISKFLHLLLNCIKSLIKSVENQQILISLFQKSFETLFEVLKEKNLQIFVHETVEQILVQYIKIFQLKQTIFSQSIIRLISHQLRHFYSQNGENNIHRQKIITKIIRFDQRTDEQLMQLE